MHRSTNNVFDTSVGIFDKYIFFITGLLLVNFLNTLRNYTITVFIVLAEQ